MTKIRRIIPLSERSNAYIAANTGLQLYLPDGTPYKGVYYIVDNQYLSTPSLQANTIILSTSIPKQTDTSLYDSLKKGNVANLFIAPIHYRPIPTDEERSIGYITRYFVMKRNEPGLFVEISEKQYNKYSNVNTVAIDANLWKRFQFKWVITGSRDYVTTTNQKTITVYEREDNLPGLSKFLYQLDEFYL